MKVCKVSSPLQAFPYLHYLRLTPFCQSFVKISNDIKPPKSDLAKSLSSHTRKLNPFRLQSLNPYSVASLFCSPQLKHKLQIFCQNRTEMKNLLQFLTTNLYFKF